MNKLMSLMAAAMLVTGSFAVGTAPADARMKKMPASHRMGCGMVSVAGRMAMLKAMPNMNSRTYRMARHGERFSVVMTKGRAHHMNGWWLVRASNGSRYWVHQSVIRCM
ncbi:MAG TPA: hypothetical protein V6D23_05105 [Candidatus Obscuribacterales bacterium]